MFGLLLQGGETYSWKEGVKCFGFGIEIFDEQKCSKDWRKEGIQFVSFKKIVFLRNKGGGKIVWVFEKSVGCFTKERGRG